MAKISVFTIACTEKNRFHINIFPTCTCMKIKGNFHCILEKLIPFVKEFQFSGNHFKPSIYQNTYFSGSVPRIAHSLHFTKCFIINCFLDSLFQCSANILPIFGIIFKNIVQSKYLIMRNHYKNY